MELGLAEIDEDVVEQPRPRKASSGGSGTPSGGGGGRGPGPGGDGPPPDHNDNTEESLSGAYKPGIWRVFTGFLLLVVLMTFGGLIAAYVVIATNRALEWQPFALPVQVWVSTAIIILSSGTYHLGKVATAQNQQATARKWFIITTVLGAAFISSQLLAWLALMDRGLYLQKNPYAGFFYVMTAVHAVHVLGGITALGSILLRSWTHTDHWAEIEYRASIAEVTGWYWHFMGGLWVVLFVLLGFWK